MEKEDIQSAAMRSAKNLQADAQPSTVEQPAASKDLPKTEAASASALPEGQDEKLSDVSGDPAASDDDDDSQEILSDDEDLFHIMTADTEGMPESYGESLLEKHRNAILEVVSLLRPYPLLPMHHERSKEFYTDVNSAVSMPSWHCVFAGCTACGLVRSLKSNANSAPRIGSILQGNNHVNLWWHHVWGDSASTKSGSHRKELTRIVDQTFPQFRARGLWCTRFK